MCDCIELINAKLAEHNGLLDFNMLASPPRAMITVVRKVPRGKKPPLLEASYCPFCGKQYKDCPHSLANISATHTAGEHDG